MNESDDFDDPEFVAAACAATEKAERQFYGSTGKRPGPEPLPDDAKRRPRPLGIEPFAVQWTLTLIHVTRDQATNEALIFGASTAGRSICVRLTDAEWFVVYVRAPESAAAESCLEVQSAIGEQLRNPMAVRDISLIERLPLMYYHPAKCRLFRLSCTVPVTQVLPALQSLVHAAAFSWWSREEGELESFEGDISPGTRLHTEMGIHFGACITATGVAVPHSHRVSRCSLECWADRAGLAVQLGGAETPMLTKCCIRALQLPPTESKSAGAGFDAQQGALVAVAAVHADSNNKLQADVFSLAPGTRQQVCSGDIRHARTVAGYAVHVFASEESLLKRVEQFLCDLDPDLLCGWDVAGGDILRLCKRFEGCLGRGLHLSRLLCGKAVTVRRFQQYSVQWVKEAHRMGLGTSNQGRWRVEGLDGRQVLDALGNVLTTRKMSLYTLEQAAQDVLGRAVEVLSPEALGTMWQTGDSGGTSRVQRACFGQAALGLELCQALQLEHDAVQMAFVSKCSYEACRVIVVVAALPPPLFLFRAADRFSVQDVVYHAQMVKVHSFILFEARRLGYVLANKSTEEVLTRPWVKDTTPFLKYPSAHGTHGSRRFTPYLCAAGEDVERTDFDPTLYSAPLAVFDFQSLYPSIFIAYNLCYSTLLRSGEDGHLHEGRDYVACPISDHLPVGHRFVTREVRGGLLPTLMQRLLSERRQCQLDKRQADQKGDSRLAMVLDSRQKALKLTANAMYGFCGAGVSPFQCMPLAETCLRFGQAISTAVMSLLQKVFSVRVVYGQTDSLFVELNASSIDEANAVAAQMVDAANASLPPCVRLVLERILSPACLFQINRYSGVERVSISCRSLLIKGLESQSRSSAPLIRQWQRWALQQLLVESVEPQRIVDETVRFVERIEGNAFSMEQFILTAALWRVEQEDIDQWPAQPMSKLLASANTPAAIVAIKRCKRDGQRFVTGERLSFVYVATAGLGASQLEEAECPVYALANSLPLKYDVYLHKFKPVIERTLAPFLCATSLRSAMASIANIKRVSRMPNNRAQCWASFVPTRKCLCCAANCGHAGSVVFQRRLAVDVDRGLCGACNSVGVRRDLFLAELEALRSAEMRLHQLRRLTGALTGGLFWRPRSEQHAFAEAHALERYTEILGKLEILGAAVEV